MNQQPRDPYRDQHGVPAWQGTPTAATPSLTPRTSTTSRSRLAMLIGGGALVLVLACCGGLAVIGALADPQQADSDAGNRPAAAVDTTDGPSGDPADAPLGDPSAAAPTEPTTGAPTAPTVTTRTVTSTESIPFGTRTVKDSSLAKGKTQVRTKGRAGVRTRTYEVTYTDGVETGRRLIRTAVTRAPVTKVVAVGTKAPKPASPRCDPNYSGCVPVASDVDCAGGSGDGPAYVSGVVRVIGRDIYDLDRDNDGLGCD